MSNRNINQLEVLIPARGGSKGLVKKNTLDFNNRPLIAWTIKNAIESNYLEFGAKYYTIYENFRQE